MTKEGRKKVREKDICSFNTVLYCMEFQQPKHRLKSSCALNVCAELFICLRIRALHVRGRVNEYMNIILGEMLSECTYRPQGQSETKVGLP